MKITNLPHEVLCNILEFVLYNTYFNAIDSNIFPIDQTQYNRNLQLQNIQKLETQNATDAREKYHRIHQGKMLILSNVKQLSNPQLENIVNAYIHEWDDEINQYFCYTDNPNSDSGIATLILNYALNS